VSHGRQQRAAEGAVSRGISTRYSRREIVESILTPSAKIAQGFETQWFKAAGVM
jgi:hypothetical protein